MLLPFTPIPDEKQPCPPPEAACEYCGGSFEPRQRGGERQRFCSATCRVNAYREAPRSTPEESQPLQPLQHEPCNGWPDDEPTLDQVDDDFDWSSDGLIKLRSQPLTAIYHNPDGDLVIRQHDFMDG